MKKNAWWCSAGLSVLVLAVALGGCDGGAGETGGDSGPGDPAPASDKVTKMIEDLDRICREQTVYMIGPEKGARLAELARKHALLDQVRNSLQNGCSDTTKLSARTEEVDRADEDADIVD